MRSKSRHFSPRHYPQAGRRGAEQRRREGTPLVEPEERLAARERYDQDRWRQQMMAKLEPERYLGMVEQGLLDSLYSDIAKAAIARRSD